MTKRLLPLPYGTGFANLTRDIENGKTKVLRLHHIDIMDVFLYPTYPLYASSFKAIQPMPTKTLDVHLNDR